jgi:hypothetical protein
VSDATHKPLDLSSLEASFAGAIRAAELRDREQPLERLVDRLLLEAADVLLDTDGLCITLERHDAQTYSAVGHIWMLSGPQEPVHVRLTFDARDVVVSGEAYFGLSSGQTRTCPPEPWRKRMSHGKSLKVLIAYPDEADHRIPWAFSFERTEAGWLLSREFAAP